MMGDWDQGEGWMGGWGLGWGWLFQSEYTHISEIHVKSHIKTFMNCIITCQVEVYLIIMTSHCVASYIDIGRLLSLFYCYSVATKHSVAASLDE